MKDEEHMQMKGLPATANSFSPKLELHFREEIRTKSCQEATHGINAGDE